jgi:hypothetical protein
MIYIRKEGRKRKKRNERKKRECRFPGEEPGL